MIIALVGASGSGKSTIENILSEKYSFEKVISYTSRPKRQGEVDGKDYHFIDNDTFKEALNRGLFAEYDEYSQGRLYGTLKSSYKDGTKVVVVTPNGLRQLKRSLCDEDIFTVYVNANLGTRVKRYIDRCGVDKFDYDDKNEIAARVERDFAMFLGIEKEADLVVNNNDCDDVFKISEEIYERWKEEIDKNIFSYTE